MATEIRRRRYRLVTSDDDEMEPVSDSAPFFQTLSPSSPHNADATPLVISDDDFLDVPDVLSPPSASPPAEEPPGYPVQDFLRNLGLRPRRQWLDACLSGLAASRAGFSGLDVAEKARLCFEKFLVSDMNLTAFGGLPPDVHSMHGVELAGPFVLQVDEIVNISLPLRGRYQESSAGLARCLKVSMSDGVQRVFGMEYRPIKQLNVLSPAGLKICICNVHIRRGVLMLVPEVVEVLGGSAVDLDAARQRLVQEVNKPPRGKRNRNGDAPSLATRASAAAWSGISADSPVETNNASTRASSLHHPVARPLTTESAGGSSREGFPVQNGGSLSEPAIAIFRTDVGDRRETLASPSNIPNIQANPSSITAPEYLSSEMSVKSDSRRREELLPAFNRKLHVQLNTSSDSVCMPITSASISNGPAIVSNQTLSDRRKMEEFPASSRRLDDELNTFEDAVSMAAVPSALNIEPIVVHDRSSSSVLDLGEVHSIVGEENSVLDNELPFTYLACMRAKWTTQHESVNSIRGKIKCFLTGVKGFEFRGRKKYELRVHVDDGSLISEVLIHHEVVQNSTGYSPEEVTAALSSPDKEVSSCMRAKMKQYQLFLAYFEGTMLVEMNRQYKVPVVLEMDQGCPSSDAQLLLLRMKASSAPRTSPYGQFNPINLSP